MNNLPAIDLLEATHQFPGEYTFKVIGHLSNLFVARSVALMRQALDMEIDPPYTFRQTANGRFVAVTFQAPVESAEQVLEVYSHLRQVEGLIMLW